MILGIDPGKRQSGYGLVDINSSGMRECGLRECGLFEGDGPTTAACISVMHRKASSKLLPWVIDITVVEKPIVYPKGREKGTKNPNDLIDLALVAGSFMLYGKQSEEVTPAGWKGQRPKDVCQSIIYDELSPTERKILQAGLKEVNKSLQHNVWDGVGIALWRAKRIFHGGRT